jgi:hypothetical protein
MGLKMAFNDCVTPGTKEAGDQDIRMTDGAFFRQLLHGDLLTFR